MSTTISPRRGRAGTGFSVKVEKVNPAVEVVHYDTLTP